MRNFILFFVLNVLVLMAFVDSKANEPIDMFGDWVVFKTIQENKTLCYAMALPQSSKTNYNNKGKSFVNIIKEFGNNNIELNTSVGYIINDSIGSVEIQIKNNKYPLVNFQDRAWAYDIEDDKNIINNLLNSASFTIYSKSKSDKYTIDIYSLNGFKEAYNKIIDICK